MARAQKEDYLHSFRFHVAVIHGDPNMLGGPEAGFSAVSAPEMTLEMVEYREGQFTYTRKQPGIPSVAEITMSRGVTTYNTQFWKWIKKAAEGGEYRVDLQILHFQRTALDGANINTDLPGRTYEVYEAVPMRHKVAADMDATASEISIQELDVAFERFDVKEGNPNPKLGERAVVGPFIPRI
jgi:phage tail-like protein